MPKSPTKAVSLHLLRQLYTEKLIPALSLVTFTYTKENGDVSERKGWLVSVDESYLRLDGNEGVKTYRCSLISKIRLSHSGLSRLHKSVQQRRG